MVFRTHLLGYLAGIRKLAGVTLVFSVIANREGLDRLALSFGKQGCVGTGVDAAGEKNAHWHVTDLAKLYGNAQLGQNAFGNLFLRDVRQWLSVIPNVPVSAFLNATVLLDS